jgi:hypothetical protein
MQKSTIGIQNFNEDQICKQGNHIPRNLRILKSHLFMLSQPKKLGNCNLVCQMHTHEHFAKWFPMQCYLW